MFHTGFPASSKKSKNLNFVRGFEEDCDDGGINLDLNEILLDFEYRVNDINEKLTKLRQSDAVYDIKAKMVTK